ncbi:hypothetical protein pipiens_018197 [Culex pipiens pipiens]|uniref:TATA-box-binding protein n=1 Tax=Culex pipiens pipiens TaxID=38569 RepID=A0ABD1CCY4_CULPP
MDQLAMSPGFSIPSIGTPLHQPEEDQQIMPHAYNQQTPSGMTPMGGGLSAYGMPSIGMGTPNKHTYAPSFAAPQSLIQPQTPQSLMSPMVPMQETKASATPSYQQQNSTGGGSVRDPDNIGSVNIHSTMGPATPMTPMTPSEPAILPQLQNIVSTVNLSCRLDLKKIALHARNAEYNPKRFAAVIMRIREPRTTALIFSSGKMVCTGAKSEEDSRLAARKYARIIQKLGFTAKFLDFKVQNMVGSCDVRFPIRLEGLVLTHGKFSSYEPELFPGLIYRMVKPRIVLLIFVSGKVVLTGAKVRQEIYDAFDNIYPILKKSSIPWFEHE